MVKQLYLLKARIPFLTSFLIYVSLTASVIAGYLVIQLIDRLGVVDGVLAIKIMVPFLFIHPFLILKSLWNNQLARLPDNNSRIAWFLLFVIILSGLIMLFKQFWNRGFFSCKIPLKTGNNLTIPIYTAGLFFFHLPEMIMMVLQLIFMHLFPSFFIKISSFLFWHPFTIISGYLLYIYLGRRVIDFSTIEDKLAESTTPQQIFNLTYKRFGIFNLTLSLIGFFLLLLNQRLKHLPLIRGEISLVFFILNYILLFLIVFLEWGTHRKIVKEHLSAVFQTTRMQDFLKARVLLEENGIKAVSHQHGYNYISGYTIGPLSEKTLFVPETEQEKALILLGELNR